MTSLTDKSYPRSHSRGPVWIVHACCCPAMGSQTFCYVVLCFLAAEPTDAGVIQTPRHTVTEKGQAVTLRCEPMSGHAALFWYRQTSGQGLEFLIYFNNQAPIDDSGMPKDRFSAIMPNASLSTLKIQPTDARDSAVYFCASSLTTALHSHPLPMQKPWGCLLSPAPSSQPSWKAPLLLPLHGR
uniref:Ig-like domain-containing protein n=1 Tax=Oryctolagus cuniculus TaxID=9986 RepID=G1TT18_RABIT